MTKTVFCANCQVDKEQEATIDGNGDFIFTCPDCGRFVKFSSETQPDEIDGLLATHKEANTGQISVASQEAKLAEMLGDTTSEGQSYVDTTPADTDTTGDETTTDPTV
jgi:uncharacterized Zn finger protein